MANEIDTDTSLATAVTKYFDGVREVSQDHMPAISLHRDDVAALRVAADTGVGAPSEWDGAGTMPTKTVDISFALTLQYVEYALQVRIPKRRAHDSPYLIGAVNERLGSETAQTMRSLVQLTKAGVFTGTQMPGSKPACSASHPTVTGTRSNLLTSVLDRAALMAAFALLRNWQTYEGTTYDLSQAPKILEVGLSLVDTAMQLLGAAIVPTAANPNTAQQTLGMAWNCTWIYNHELDDDSWIVNVPSGVALEGDTSSVITGIPVHLWLRDDAFYDAWIDPETKAVCSSVDWAQQTGIGPLPDRIVGSSVT